jgi:hypothetical protein
MLKADASGLPAEGTNTDTEVSSAVSLKHSNSYDPTSDQKAALAGTSGSPSSGNQYVTDVDSRINPRETQFLVGDGVVFQQGQSVVELLLGTLTLDCSKFEDKMITIVASIDPTLSSGDVWVRMYDVGPAAGPPTAETQITEDVGDFSLTTNATGPVFLETDALSLEALTDVGEVMSASRRYEFRLYLDADPGDSVVIGSVGLRARG